MEKILRGEPTAQPHIRVVLRVNQVNILPTEEKFRRRRSARQHCSALSCRGKCRGKCYQAPKTWWLESRQAEFLCTRGGVRTVLQKHLLHILPSSPKKSKQATTNTTHKIPAPKGSSLAGEVKAHHINLLEPIQYSTRTPHHSNVRAASSKPS
jgi:hypothetical protein